MSVRGKIKVNARRATTQNYVKALSVTLILICVQLLFAVFILAANTLFELFGGYLFTFRIISEWHFLISPIIVAASLLLQLILFSPLLMGNAKWYYALVGNETSEVLDLFDYFSDAKHYFSSVWMELNLFVRSFFFTFLFSVLPVSIGFYGFYLLQGGLDPQHLQTPIATLLGTMLIICACVLLAVAGIFAWIFLKRYFLARYLFLEEGCSVRRAIKQSVYFMKGRKSELFILDLSFIGWFISCIFLVPILYVLPYYSSTRALYARVLIEQKQRMTAEPPTEEIPEEDLRNPTREFDALSSESSPTVEEDEGPSTSTRE